MKTLLVLAATCFFFMYGAHAQSAPTAHPPQVASAAPSSRDSDDIEELRADIQRLKVLLNQMRNNLAFVDTSQSPLKHQFELEADAWQLTVDQMDRRLRRLEESRSPAH